MRIVPILFRMKRKPDLRLCVKAYMNCRVPKTRQQGEGPRKNGPVQIHLGYLPPTNEARISDGQRKKLRDKLREHWQVLFGNADVEIDWADAETKWVKLRARLGFAIMEQGGLEYEQLAAPANAMEPGERVDTSHDPLSPGSIVEKATNTPATATEPGERVDTRVTMPLSSSVCGK
jgi:hypothetical protein